MRSVLYIFEDICHIVPTTSVAAKTYADTSVAADNTNHIALLVP